MNGCFKGVEPLNSWVSHRCGGLGYVQCSELNDSSVIQGFSNQKAGNMALHTGESPERVMANHRRFLRCLGLEDYRLTAAYQIHGTRVAVVDGAYPGKPVTDVADLIPETDALITREPGLALAIFTADCMPIFYYDLRTPAIGIAHAGWRGTLNEIARITLEAMSEAFGTNPADCRVALGPAICGKCFQVGAELADIFSNKYPNAVRQGDGGAFVDLAIVNTIILQQAGVPQNAIVQSNFCTICHSEPFFSYRATKTSGRMMGVIALRGGCRVVTA